MLWVMIEVCIFTALLGLAMHALGELQIVNGDVNAPGAEGVRDYMLRYMGEVFVGGALGPALGHTFGFIVSIVFGLLLLSAVNTAIVAAAVGRRSTPPPSESELMPAMLGAESILCAVRGTGRTLDFALKEARETGRRLYLLFVREQPFMTEHDAKRKWQEDEEASKIFGHAKQKAGDVTPLFAYAVSPSAAETIVDVAATLGASRVILGAPQRGALMNLIRGSVIREVSNSLPEEIDLLVIRHSSFGNWRLLCLFNPEAFSSRGG
jgi:nucleotide-binding universal stress UspA family protein